MRKKGFLYRWIYNAPNTLYLCMCQSLICPHLGCGGLNPPASSSPLLGGRAVLVMPHVKDGKRCLQPSLAARGLERDHVAPSSPPGSCHHCAVLHAWQGPAVRAVVVLWCKDVDGSPCSDLWLSEQVLEAAQLAQNSPRETAAFLSFCLMEPGVRREEKQPDTSVTWMGMLSAGWHRPAYSRTSARRTRAGHM